MHIIYLQYPDMVSSMSLALQNPLCPLQHTVNESDLGEVGWWESLKQTIRSLITFISNIWIKKEGSECCSVTLACYGTGWGFKVSV